MPLNPQILAWLQDLSIAELLQLAIWVSCVIRAKITGIYLSIDDINHSTLSGLEREADLAWERELAGPNPATSVDH